MFCVFRILDKFFIFDLFVIGCGNDFYDENKNGLFVFDECGIWFNICFWNDKERQLIIDWFLYVCKLGWDIIFFVQDLFIVDKQVCFVLVEYVVYCCCLDRIILFFVGILYFFIIGLKMFLFKLYVGVVKYGDF